MFVISSIVHHMFLYIYSKSHRTNAFETFPYEFLNHKYSMSNQKCFMKYNIGLILRIMTQRCGKHE